MYFRHLLFFAFILKCLTLCKAGCKDERGKNVDWFVVYKLPKQINKGVNSGPNNPGSRYIYVTNSTNSNSKKWYLSTKYISGKKSFIGINLKSLYSANSRLSYLFYNDEPPNQKVDSNLAHAKGVLVFEGRSGFWLVHSVPKFPSLVEDGYHYPKSGLTFGQIFLCMSFQLGESANEIVEHLLTVRPKVYDHRISKSLHKALPSIDDLINKKWSTSLSKTTKFKTAQGNTFFNFGRNGKAENDVYTDMIASIFSVNLFVESWRRGAGGSKPSDCKVKHQVSNIKKLKWQNSMEEDNSDSEQQWSFLEDHAKWAVSQESNAAYTCIGDVNRMHSQLRRGGGAVCTQNFNLWKSFTQLVEDVELCAKNNSRKYFKSTLLFLIAILASTSVSFFETHLYIY